MFRYMVVRSLTSIRTDGLHRYLQHVYIYTYGHRCSCNMYIYEFEVKLTTILDPSNVETQVMDDLGDPVKPNSTEALSEASLQLLINY